MSLKDYGELTRELLERVFDDVRQSSVMRPTCKRCGYEPDSDGYCGFCGHLNHWRRSR